MPVDPKADSPLSAQNNLENEAHIYVCFPPSCSRSESGDGRLKAAATAITVFVSVQWPKLGRKRTGGYRTQRGVVTQSGGDVRSNVVKLFTLLLHG